MTDRELLELAAKAAGIEGYWFEEYGDNQLIPERVGLETEQGDWNPLTDDGDALRLAVQLGMLFMYMPDRFDLFQQFYREELDNDLRPTEATRRAIVRAAAEIGKEQS